MNDLPALYIFRRRVQIAMLEADLQAHETSVYGVATAYPVAPEHSADVVFWFPDYEAQMICLVSDVFTREVVEAVVALAAVYETEQGAMLARGERGIQGYGTPALILPYPDYDAPTMDGYELETIVTTETFAVWMVMESETDE